MARTILMAFILWLGMALPSAAGEITGIEMHKKASNEIEITIKGQCKSYRAFGLPSPARFVIDLDGAQSKKDLPEAFEINGSVVSKIRTLQKKDHLRIVLDSANKDRLFHCTIKETDLEMVVNCWMPEAAAEKPVKRAKASPAFAPASRSPLTRMELGDLFGWPGIEDKQVKKETKRRLTYSGEKITLDFYKTDIHNVFRLFAEVSGKNIVIDDQVKGELTLSLKEVPWDSALEIILDMKGLTKEEKLNTFIIQPRVEKTGGKGELVVREFSEKHLQPARLLKRRQENMRKAEKIVLKAYNLEIKGEKEEALSQYEKAFALQKDNIDLINKMAYLNYILGNFAKSYYFAGEALKLNAKDAGAALYGALSAARMEKTEAAGVLFRLATGDALPRIPEAFYNYGLFLESQKDYATALVTYKRYKSLFGPSLEVSMAIARLYEQQNMTEEACNTYKDIQYSGFSMDKNIREMVQEKIRTLCIEGGGITRMINKDSRDQGFEGLS